MSHMHLQYLVKNERIYNRCNRIILVLAPFLERNLKDLCAVLESMAKNTLAHLLVWVGTLAWEILDPPLVRNRVSTVSAEFLSDQ